MFRLLNRVVLGLWDLGLGPWMSLGLPGVFGQYAVLLVTGRKSGKRYRVPLNFADGDGDVFITAGFGPKTDWFLNLMANPRVEVWLPRGRFAARAELVTGPDRLPALRAVLKGSGFAAWVFGGVNPHWPDDRLAGPTAEYQVVRLRLASGP